MTVRISVAISLLVLLNLAPLPRAEAQNIEMGSTYHLLDGKATRVTTEFSDAQVVTERTAQGVIVSSLFSPDGVVLGSLRADEITGRVELELSHAGRELREAQAFPPNELTTDWANLQLYSLWADSHRASHLNSLRGRLILDEGLFRVSTPSGADVAGGGPRGPGYVHSLRKEELSVTTEFGDLIARSQRSGRQASATPGAPGYETYHASYTTYLVNRKTGKTLGLARLFEDARVFVWDFGELSSGYASNETVPGGWSFDHNMAWANIQSFGFWYLHQAQLATLDSPTCSTVSEGLTEATSRSSSLHGVALELAPSGNTLAPKNQPGCDVLTFLDGSIYEPCCHEHDQCYGYDPQSNELTRDDPCTFWSWLFVEGWRCMQCNLDVLLCFLSTTFDGPDGPGGGGGGGGGDSCTVSGAEWCPAECFSCTRQYY